MPALYSKISDDLTLIQWDSKTYQADLMVLKRPGSIPGENPAHSCYCTAPEPAVK